MDYYSSYLSLSALQDFGGRGVPGEAEQVPQSQCPRGSLLHRVEGRRVQDPVPMSRGPHAGGRDGVGLPGERGVVLSGARHVQARRLRPGMEIGRILR